MTETKITRKPRKRSIRYSYALTKKILSLVESKMTITKICELPDMPDRRSIHRWRHEHPDFHEKMKRSEDIRLSFLVDEMIDLTDDRATDYLRKIFKKEPTRLEVADENIRRRLRVDTIKFLSAKLYGTKNYDVEVNNGDSVVNVLNYQPKTPDQELPTKIIADLQPAHLKKPMNLTPAQKAQLEASNHS